MTKAIMSMQRKPSIQAKEETKINSIVRKTEFRTTYFLFRFPLLKPPVESNKDASSVAGFFEARKAQIRRYLAQADI